MTTEEKEHILWSVNDKWINIPYSTAADFFNEEYVTQKQSEEFQDHTYLTLFSILREVLDAHIDDDKIDYEKVRRE